MGRRWGQYLSRCAAYPNFHTTRKYGLSGVLLLLTAERFGLPFFGEEVQDWKASLNSGHEKIFPSSAKKISTRYTVLSTSKNTNPNNEHIMRALKAVRKSKVPLISLC